MIEKENIISFIFNFLINLALTVILFFIFLLINKKDNSEIDIKYNNIYSEDVLKNYNTVSINDIIMYIWLFITIFVIIHIIKIPINKYLLE
jgi:hypothetical protein